MKDRRTLNSGAKGNADGLVTFLDMTCLLHEITEGRLTGELTIGRRRIQMLNGSERTTVMLHSNDQQRTEND